MKRLFRHLLGTPRRPITKPRLNVESLETRIQPANLTMTSISLCDTAGKALDTVAVGQLVSVRAEFTATGLGAGAGYFLKYSLDGAAHVSNLLNWGAGAAGTGTYVGVLGDWVVKSNSGFIRAEVDVSKMVAETNELDNVKTLAFTPVTFKAAYTGETKLKTPLDGTPNVHWKIQNYVDLDSGPGKLDYMGHTGGSAKTYDGHNGMDFSAVGFDTQHVGLPIRAAAGGIVTQATDAFFDENDEMLGEDADGGYWGNYVTIDHGNGWESNYIHLRKNSANVKVGDFVNAGDELGLMASSGNSTGTHLHFRLTYNGKLVEPYVAASSYWINPLPYSGMAPFDNPSLQVFDKFHVTEHDGFANVPVFSPGIAGGTVDYTAVSGSAKAGSDFTGVSGSVSFDFGELVKYVHVPVTNDTQHEADEQFVVKFSSGQAPMTWTITDNDALLHFEDGALTINADTSVGNDVVTLAIEGANVKATVNNETRLFPLDGLLGTVQEIVVNTGDGNDTVNVLNVPDSVKMTINAGEGADSINVGAPNVSFSNFYSLNEIVGQLVLHGGGGADTVNLKDFDFGDPNVVYMFSSGHLSRSDASAASTCSISYDSIQNVNLTAGGGDDIIDIVGYNPAVTLSLNAGAGNDSIGGPSSSNKWLITGKGIGSVGSGAVKFSSLENIDGGTGDDTFTFTQGGSLTGSLYGSAGSNTVDYSALSTPVTVNRDSWTATAVGSFFTIDTFVGGSSSADTLIGRDIQNTFKVLNTNITVLNNSLTAYSFENLKGGASNDTFKFVEGANVTGKVDGQGGIDVLDYSAWTSDATIDLGSNTSSGTGSFVSIESVIGGAGSDTLAGAGISGTSTWYLNGLGTGSFARSGVNMDFAGIENLKGSAASDKFVFSDGAGVAGQIDGAGGIDSLNYANYTTPISVNIGSSTATGASKLLHVESIIGGQSTEDSITGGNGFNNWKITGKNAGSVNATTYFSGIENLYGGTSGNVFAFNAGGSVGGKIIGGDGSDTLDYSALSTAVNVNLRTGVATGVGDARNLDNVYGGGGADKLVGNAGTNILKGNGGADNLDGEDGADILLGGAGNDVLTGGLGRDFLFGGQGIDKLYGGADDDVLVGGATTLDTKDGALLAMLQQWQREDLDYDQRINVLRNTGVLGGQFKLNAAAVSDDGVKNVLTGGAELDWFWAFGAGNTADQTDKIHSEQLK